jgi:DNA repair exonuclease SbcCD ATPase subunit
MLLEKSRQLKNDCQQKIEREKKLKHHQGFEDRYKRIKQELKELLELVETLRLFRQKSLIVSDFQPRLKKPLEIIERVVRQFQDDPESILDNGIFNGQDFKKLLDSLKNTIRKQLLIAWQNYLRLEMPKTDDATLDLFGKIEDLKSAVQKIRQLNSQIDRDKFPRYEQEFENVESLIQQLTQVWQDLDTNHIPESVRIFLQDATSPVGASVSLYTPEVQEWFQSRNLSKTLKIRVH